MAAWFAPVFKLIGPLSKEAARGLAQYVATHPEARDAVLTRVKAAGRSVDALRQARTPAARIGAKLAIVERFASAQVGDPIDPGAVAMANQWLQRSQQIRDALALAETQSGEAKSRILDRLAGRTDALAAEAIESLIPEEAPGDVELDTPKSDDDGGEQ